MLSSLINVPQQILTAASSGGGGVAIATIGGPLLAKRFRHTDPAPLYAGTLPAGIFVDRLSIHIIEPFPWGIEVGSDANTSLFAGPLPGDSRIYDLQCGVYLPQAVATRIGFEASATTGHGILLIYGAYCPE